MPSRTPTRAAEEWWKVTHVVVCSWRDASPSHTCLGTTAQNELAGWRWLCVNNLWASAYTTLVLDSGDYFFFEKKDDAVGFIGRRYCECFYVSSLFMRNFHLTYKTSSKFVLTEKCVFLNYRIMNHFGWFQHNNFSTTLFYNFNVKPSPLALLQNSAAIHQRQLATYHLVLNAAHIALLQIQHHFLLTLKK